MKPGPRERICTITANIIDYAKFLINKMNCTCEHQDKIQINFAGDWRRLAYEPSKRVPRSSFETEIEQAV